MVAITYNGQGFAMLPITAAKIESKKLRIYSSAKLKNVTAILPNRLLAAATGIKGK